MSTATKQRQRTCDNCAKMTLMLCGDGLLHRHCDDMNLYINDLNTQAVCTRHIGLLPGKEVQDEFSQV